MDNLKTKRTVVVKAVRAEMPPSASIIKVLAAVKLLYGLNPDELADIAKQCRYKRFAANEMIFDRNSEASDIYFIIRGRVRIVNYSLSGREITLDDIARGGHFGELAAIDGGPRSATVMALGESLIIALPRYHFLKAIKKYPVMAVNVMKHMSKIIRTSTERIMDLSTLGANNRVHADLLRQAKMAETKDNQVIIDPMPIHGDIASRVSTTRETVARVMNELARSNIVERQKDVLIIRDMKRLQDMVEEVRGD